MKNRPVEFMDKQLLRVVMLDGYYLCAINFKKLGVMAISGKDIEAMWK